MMLRCICRKLCDHTEGKGEIWPLSFAQLNGFHSGQPSLAPRSFFGVEDFLDDDNSRPYTCQKGRKSKNTTKHVSFKQRTVAYMEPFTLDVFISKRFFSASITQSNMQTSWCGRYKIELSRLCLNRYQIYLHVWL